VEAHHQMIAASLVGPELPDTGGQGIDISRLVVVAGDKAQIREPSPAAQRFRQAVKDGTRRGGGVLRIKRQDQQSPHVGRPQLLQGVGDGRIPVTHAQNHMDRPGHCRLQHACQALALFLRPVQEWRTVFRPDLGVSVGGAFRPDAEDHAVQDEPPQEARHFYHPWIRQELGKISSYGAGRGSVRGAEIHHHYAQGIGCPVPVVFLIDISWHWVRFAFEHDEIRSY